jgi:hypothetical protein
MTAEDYRTFDDLIYFSILIKQHFHKSIFTHKFVKIEEIVLNLDCLSIIGLLKNIRAKM